MWWDYAIISWYWGRGSPLTALSKFESWDQVWIYENFPKSYLGVLMLRFHCKRKTYQLKNAVYIKPQTKLFFYHIYNFISLLCCTNLSEICVRNIDTWEICLLKKRAKLIQKCKFLCINKVTSSNKSKHSRLYKTGLSSPSYFIGHLTVN